MKSIAAVIIAVASVAAGCSSLDGMLDSRKVDYKSAGQLPPLEIPPDLTRPTTDDRFAVPDINPKGSATYSAYSRERSAKQVSTNSDILPKVSNAHIERAGTQRWLVVEANPDALWPTVKAFWQEIGFLVNLEVPEAGVMETDWAESRARIDDGVIRGALGKLFGSVSSTAERDKFRTRLERGVNGKTTEIYISHRGMIEVFANSAIGDEKTMWQPRPADPDLEAEMLRRLMVRFGVQEARAQADLQRASANPNPKAQITRSADGAGRLTIEDPFDRAWRRVGLALDRVGFTVEDRDRSKGLYFVRYVDPDADARSKKSTGLLSKLAFWRDDDDPKNRKAQYRIAVKDAANGSEVNVLDMEGKLDRSATANRILTLLYEQLK
ncbi:MAG: outer membrane protein assembly factor BamC [Betaproteobacteria bacterium]|nr:outer membrane protein assembly factor BamC [Betaproteobacteria bacterium]